MPHEVESMFYTREVPWHGLGVRVEEAPDSETALVKAGLLWAVTSEPVYFADGLIPGYKANVRSTDRAVLGVVTDSYRIVQNREAFAFTDALLGEGVRYETAGSLRGGKRIWLLARLPERYKVLDDDVEPYVCFSNSHDGWSAVRVILTPVRVVCNNTLTLALNGAPRTWSTQHVGNVHDRLEEARRTLGLAQAYYETLCDEADRLVNIPVNMEELIAQLFPMPDNAEAKRAAENAEERRAWFRRAALAPDLKAYYGTAWGFVNAAADMACHREPERQTDTWKERRLEAAFDGPMLLNQAYALVSGRG